MIKRKRPLQKAKPSKVATEKGGLDENQSEDTWCPCVGVGKNTGWHLYRRRIKSPKADYESSKEKS